MMNPGDTLKVTIKDNTNGLLTQVDDVTTAQSGFVVASGANGFMNTNPATCAGSAFDFHAEYDTAAQANQVPWAALEGGVLAEHEIGHFEPCSSVSSPEDISPLLPSGDADTHVNQVCNGGFEGASAVGEGPCATSQTGTTCSNSTTEGPTYGGQACNGSNLCESADAFCIPLGTRPITQNAVVTSFSWPVAGCQQNQFQNGDLDYDGSPYVADWPDGSPNHPTSYRYIGPFDAVGNSYPQTQFETDVGGSENDCVAGLTGGSTGCTAPPHGAKFYPFWTMTNNQSLDGLSTSQANPCVWNFGNDIPSITTNDFSQASQYGSSSARFAGTLISAPVANPTANGTCPRLTLASVSSGPAAGTPEAPAVPLLGLAALVAFGVGWGLRGRRRQRTTA